MLCTALLAFAAFVACNGNGEPDEQADTAVACEQSEQINQYDSEGRKTGHWTYVDETTGWLHNENYEEGVLEGHAVLSYNDITYIDVDYRKGIVCGEMLITFEGTEGNTGIRLTNITKVDTMINGTLFGYRAHCKTDCVYEGIDSSEGTCYYIDVEGLQREDGFLGTGEWLVTNERKVTKHIKLDKPTPIFNIK